MPRVQKKKPARSTDVAPIVSKDEISREAFRIYQARHGAPGDPVADWFQAERNLIQRRSTVSSRQAQPPTASNREAQAGAGSGMVRNGGRRGTRRRSR